ncbi:diguanylate cyclase [Pseudomonas putida]|uniref:Diguanylate cyclase n=1 Tax=Pseudomonas putida TaxID=303 RepID=A0A3M8TPG4_PSEPU|nr:diguanylate cyclase [Pseudomonas putida]
MPGIEGDAGLSFCVACAGLFAGKPAPTGTAPSSSPALNLWERVHPRRGRTCLC